MKKSEAEILDLVLVHQRDIALVRIFGLLDGTNEEDDNIHQILDDVLLQAYIEGRNE